PKMIDEFLATLMDGRALEGDPAPLGPWVDEIPRAVDYALLGIAMHALVSSLWLRMALAYGRMRVALADVAEDGSPLAKLRARVERDWESMAPSHLDRPAQCAWEEARFGET